MVNKYILRYLPVAVDDLISIFDWIAHDSPAHAAAFVDKLDQRIGSLKNHPFLGRVPRDEKLKNTGIFYQAVSIFVNIISLYGGHGHDNR